MKAALFLLCISFASLCLAQERHVEKAGGFSFVPPTGLPVSRELPGLKFKFHFAPSKDGFAANLNFVDDPVPAPWKDYVEASLDVLKTGAKAEILEKPAPFALDSKIECMRFVYKMSATGRETRHICFLIHVKPDAAIVATFSSLPADGTTWDEPIAKSIRTFTTTPTIAP